MTLPALPTILQLPEEEVAPHIAALLLLFRDLTALCNREEMFKKVCDFCQVYLPSQRMVVALINDDGASYTRCWSNATAADRRHPAFISGHVQAFPLADGFVDIILDSELPLVFDIDELMRRNERPVYIPYWYELQAKELVCVRLRAQENNLGCLFLHMDRKRSVGGLELRLLQVIASQLSLALACLFAAEKSRQQHVALEVAQEQLNNVNTYVQEQIKITCNYDELIGSSPVLQEMFHLVNQVAMYDSTVLLSGETGTGKELVARAIHRASGRRHKLMIKVNCASMPEHLVESELFGHEKGSFTGAVERRIGKFELAAHSTLFLDEVGELSMEVQVKLLRALQEKEIERIGGHGTISTHVRIIAASSRNLLKEVDAGRFRSDLYYRLHVFPIHVPPLREHKEDIPELVMHFLHRYARETGKPVTGVSNKALKMMTAYSWPGNVRELEHLVERSVLLATGKVITDIELPSRLVTENKQLSLLRMNTLEEHERQHIMAALKASRGRIRGIGGAAAILDVPATTLHSKMAKLGITRQHKG